MKHWLIKSEPDVFSIDDLERAGSTGWDCVRNYLARNYMRDGMSDGDLALFYHSNAEPSGVAGIARVVGPAVADPTQFDPASPYHDETSDPDAPRWQMRHVAFVERFARTVSLAELKAQKGLKGMAVLQKGQRLSVLPVEAKHFAAVLKLGRK